MQRARDKFWEGLRQAKWAALFYAFLAITNLHASTFSTGPNNCQGCHLLPPQMLSQSATYGKIIPLVDDGRFDQSCKSTAPGGATNCTLRQKIAGNVSMAGVEGNFNEDELEAIRLYLLQVRDAHISNTTPVFSPTALTASSTATFSVQISNFRRLPINYNLSLSGGAAGDFTILSQTPSPTPSCTASQVPATSSAAATVCTISVTVRFEPTATGPRTTTLVVGLTPSSASDPVPNSTANITLSGTGTAQFDISATTLNFGSITAGTTAVRSAIIRNLGGAPFNLNTLTFSGGSAALYTLAPGNACTAGLSLPAGGQCQLDVRFSPTIAGSSLDASLTIAHGAAGSPQGVTLLGAATPAPQGQIALSPLSLTFPDTPLGSSTALSITVLNSGSAPLNFTGFTMGGTHPGDFLRSGDCSIGTPLAIGAQCTLTITFRPSALLAHSASITILSDASNSSVLIALGGTGVPVPAPQVSLLPATLDFGQQTLGGLYPRRVITLQNVGTATLSVSSIVVTGSSFTNASGVACPAALAPGASCAIEIAFNPTAANTDYTGTLRVISNAAGSPHDATLRGRGTAASVPALLWSPVTSVLNFGSISAGSVSAPQSVTLLNNGPGGVTLGVINAVGPDGAAFPAGGGTCAPGLVLFEGGTCTIEVRFAPASAGGKNASLQIASSGSFPPALSMTGTGLAGASPDLALSTTALALSETRVGAQSLPADVILSGTGAGVVTVTGMEVQGPYSLRSKTCPAMPFSLAAGSTCAVSVTFDPQTVGSATGVLRITTNASPAVREISLSGQGISQADVSGGGGCSMSLGSRNADPILWILLLLALAGRAYRHHADKVLHG